MKAANIIPGTKRKSPVRAADVKNSGKWLNVQKIHWKRLKVDIGC